MQEEANMRKENIINMFREVKEETAFIKYKQHSGEGGHKNVNYRSIQCINKLLTQSWGVFLINIFY